MQSVCFEGAMRAIILGYGCCTRYTISADYVSNGWTFRTEYIHSTGNAFAKTLTDSDEASATDCNLSKNGNKADGFYALGIAPIVANKINVKARYDLYRSNGEWNAVKNIL